MVVVGGEALIDRLPGTDSPGGGPYNTARSLARLGIPTQFLGRLSTDAFGRQLRDLLAADGVDLSLTSFGPEPTTLAIADVDPDGHAAYRFIIDGTSAPNLTRPMLPASLSTDVRAPCMSAPSAWCSNRSHGPLRAWSSESTGTCS
jgi:fructokinase